MDTFLKLTPADQLDAYLEVNRAMGLDAASVEKDFWVCWTLRELFTAPGIGDHLTFKGGTSLSKAWKLIQRFSEDIDLIVDKEILGFGGDAAPDKAPSNKQRKARLEGLMDACRVWVQETLQPALASRVQSALGENGWKLEVDPDMPDGQCLLFHYPTVFPPSASAYIRPVVKIELGARSDDWPHVNKSIQPYVTEHFSTLDPEPSCIVRVLAAERTFWEKACLLHEETFRPTNKPRKHRMARHYYDLWCLLRAGIGDKALEETALFQRVAEHRELFFRFSWVDYTTHKHGSFRLAPPPEHLADWKSDYSAMLGPMFFGDTPSFDEIITLATEFETAFNAGDSTKHFPESSIR
jgi:predicted nucleotidyltransferase component of viral defense system